MKRTISKDKASKIISENFIVMTSVQTDFEKIKCSYLYFKPFRRCSAKVAENDEYIVLKSYSTIVCYIRKSDMYCFDVLRLVYGYTSTSCQHIRKFIEEYSPAKVFSYRVG